LSEVATGHVVSLLVGKSPEVTTKLAAATVCAASSTLPGDRDASPGPEWPVVVVNLPLALLTKTNTG